MDARLVQVFCVLSLVGTAAYFDIRSRRIPNALIVCAVLIALAIQARFASVWEGLAGLSVGFALFIPGYLLKQMGAGDVKLMAAVGAFFSAEVAFRLGLAAYLCGAAFALVWMLLQHDGVAWLKYLLWRLRIVWMLLATGSGRLLQDSDLSQARPGTASMPYSLPVAAAVIYGLLLGW
jgi:prepilin peptidase CpaA